MSFDLIRAMAQATPQRPALWFAGRWYSYGELDARANRCANLLRQRGLHKGDRVAVLALNHLAHFDLLLAAPRCGIVYTPFNYRLSPPELQQISAYVTPELLLADPKYASLAIHLGVPALTLDAYELALAATSAEPPPAVALTPDDTHMILFTGGSTGLPKGALLPYRQIAANCRNTVAGWQLDADDCVIQATPCFHAALNVFSTPLLSIGGRIVLLPQFDAGAYLAAASRERCTQLFMVPTMFQMLAGHPDFASADLSAVRWAISGGAPCPPPVAQAFAARGIRFKQGFGMTEAGVNCFTIGLDEAAQHPDAVGRPLPHTEAVIRRADGSACAPGEIGELTLRGEHVCSGYFERPAEWRKVFRDGWLWTGDLARRDAAGLHYIVGRSKEMYISGGENVYPAEVEAALSQCAGVAECAVIGVPHVRWGEVGLAAVALKPGTPASAEDLRAVLKQMLAGYKVPQEFLFLPVLPKSGAGKIAKTEIRLLWERQTGSGG